MSRNKNRYDRILGIAPCSKGFGFALLEGGTLIDSQIVRVRGNEKNTRCLQKIERLIESYQPEVLSLEDTGAENSRRMARIQDLSQSILAVSLRNKVPVVWFTMKEVKRWFFGKGSGTKYEIAQEMANRFPKELGDRLPPKRRLWESQDPRIDLFHAVALTCVAYRASQQTFDDDLKVRIKPLSKEAMDFRKV